MKLEQVLPFFRRIIKRTTASGEICVDCTVGNGNDTVFLAELVGATGKVFGFDIQEQAIKNTTMKLAEQNLTSQVELFCTGHENLKKHIPKEFHGKIASAVFNLGYLPGGEKSITTNSKTTIQAVESLLEIMKPEGIIVLVVYHGHPEGKIECDDLLEFSRSIPLEKAHTLEYKFTNHKNAAPFIIAIEKRS